MLLGIVFRFINLFDNLSICVHDFRIVTIFAKSNRNIPVAAQFLWVMEKLSADRFVCREINSPSKKILRV